MTLGVVVNRILGNFTMGILSWLLGRFLSRRVLCRVLRWVLRGFDGWILSLHLGVHVLGKVIHRLLEGSRLESCRGMLRSLL